MQGLHDIFHKSFQKKSFGYEPLIIENPKNMILQPNLTYEELLVQIVDCKEPELRNR